MEIDAIRARIDAVDAQMTALFEERLALVYQVAAYKAAHGEAVFDSRREQEVIEKNRKHIKDPAHMEAYTEFIRMVMDQSKAVQRQYMAAHAGENED